jgi:hypothetical protein
MYATHARLIQGGAVLLFPIDQQGSSYHWRKATRARVHDQVLPTVDAYSQTVECDVDQRIDQPELLYLINLAV